MQFLLVWTRGKARRTLGSSTIPKASRTSTPFPASGGRDISHDISMMNILFTPVLFLIFSARTMEPWEERRDNGTIRVLFMILFNVYRFGIGDVALLR